MSSLELTRTFLERIERYNQRLGAYITVMGEQALRSAEEADDAIARGEYRGPMHGIPIALKDQVYTKGVRTTAGSSILADFVPDEDATIVKKLERRGSRAPRQAEPQRVRHGRHAGPHLRPAAQPVGASIAAPAAPAAAPASPSPPGCPPRPSAKTPPAPYATPRRSAAWWALSPAAARCRATALCRSRGRWTPPAR